MLDQAEAKVKISMDDSSVNVGLKESVANFDSWREKVEGSIKPLHSAFTQLRHLTHLFGASAALMGLEHLVHYGKEIYEWFNKDSEAMEKMIETANKGIEKLGEQLRELRNKSDELSLSRMKLMGASPEDIAEAQEAIGKRLAANVTITAAHQNFAEQEVEEAKKGYHFGDKESETRLAQAEEKVRQAELEHGNAVNALEAHRNSLIKERQSEREEFDKKVEQEAEEEAKQEKERNEQLHKLEMYHLEQEKIKKAEARSIKDIQDGENKAYQPSVQQILNSGWFSNHGKRFHSSWAANQEQDIQDMSTGIQEDIANFGMSDDIKQRMENVNKMKGELNNFLGATGTPEERIANATKDSADHLKAIREAFYNTQ